MKISVDRSRCAGLGICESLVPDVFEIDDDADLQLLRGEIPVDELPAVEEAVAACPTGALSLQKAEAVS